MSTPSFVAYIILSPKRNRNQVMFSNDVLSAQEKRIEAHLSLQTHAHLHKTFIESADNQRYRHRWPQLTQAINHCLMNNANLIIGEIRNLTHNDAFTNEIFRLLNAPDYNGEIICCDQPLIKRENFASIVKYAQDQKKLHGELIKAGLSKTTAKSGNPHASDVITKVNKPKIDSAIVFALILAPVIMDYQAKGYSQRKMVSILNQEGFTAPEGGLWVLSQLQKVLERMKINECALTLEKQLAHYQLTKTDTHAIAAEFNNNKIASPKGKMWTAEMVEKVIERVSQLKEIIKLNEFIIEIMPLIEKYHVDELTDDLLSTELQQAGFNLNPSQLTGSPLNSLNGDT